MELELGEEYIEPGYEVRDSNGNRNEEKEAKVTVEGSVDTDKVGEYEIRYRFENQTLKRHVYVVDGSGGSSENIDSSESKEETEGSIESSETNPEETNEPTATESPNPTKKPSATQAPTAEPTNKPSATQAPTAEPTNKPSKPSAKPEESPEPTERPGKPTPTPEPKKEYDMSSVKFASATFTYDGNAHNIFISGELPKGVSVSYTGNGKVDAGTYTVTAHFHGDDKHQAIPDMTAKLTINKAVYQLSGVKFESKTFTYDGKQHSITATGIPNGVTASYVDNTRTEVGSNKATVTFGLSEVLNKNYSSISPSTLSATITIKGEEPNPTEKPSYDMSGVIFKGETFTYDGSEHSIFISGKLPTGVSVTYTGNGKVNAGTYTVTAHFNGDDKHQAIPDMTAKLTINKAVYQLSGVKFESKTFTYDGKQHSITATGIPNGVTASYVDNTRTEVGSNKATVTFGLSEVLNKNYSSISPSTLSATITIKGEEPNPTEKPSYDMSGVIFKGETFTYDGSEHSIFISGKLPTGVSVTYTGNGKVNAGTYTVTAHFNGDDKHQPIPDMTAILTINKAVFTISGVAFNSATVTYDGQQHTITPTGIPNGITVNLANNARTNAGESTATANFGLSEELSKNYSSVSPSSLTATLTILKATPDMSGVTLSGKTVTYNSRPYSLEISGSLPAGVSVSYIGNGVTEVGSYTITAVFSVADSSNWNTPSSMTATLIIEKDKNDNPDEGDKENPDDDDEDGDDNPDEGDKDNPDNDEEDDEPDSVTPSNPGGSEEDDEPGSVIPSNPGGSEEDNNVAIAESTNFSELDGDKPGDVVQQNPDVAVEVIYSITQQREDASESEAKSLDI